MARKRKKNSTYPFSGLGLEKEEEEKLIKLLKIKDSSATRLKRALVRQWIKDNEHLIK